jgi:two-component system, OmpR family, response regulator ResD
VGASGVVAVVNSSQDVTEILRLFLEHAGYVVVTAYTQDIRDGDVDLPALIRQYQPRVIVYDIALPYDINWRLFETIRDSPACVGVRFVLTTTNILQVQKIVGPAIHVLEIVGKPYDLDLLLQMVDSAMRNPK